VLRLVPTLLVAHGDVFAREPGAPADEDRKVTAVSLYEEGLKHYRLAEYDDAITAFRQAYRLSNAPEFLYDIAQSYRLKGPSNCAQALQFYKTYINIAPDTPKRAAVEAAITDMETCSRDNPQAMSQAKPSKVDIAIRPSAPPPEESAPPGWIPWTVGGIGLALAATGSALLVSYEFDYKSLRDSRCAPSCDTGAVDRLRTRRTVGYLLLGTGGAVLGTGVVLWFVSRDGHRGRGSAFVRPTLGTIETGLVF
jgi:tetratricopeptide (TPR) repeat protein